MIGGGGGGGGGGVRLISNLNVGAQISSFGSW